MAGKPIQDDELSAFADNELSPERSAEVEAWLSEHPGDAARLDVLRAQDDAIRAAYDPIMTEPLPEKLAALGRETPKAGRWPVARWATAAAAVLAIFTAGFVAARIVPPPTVVAQQESLAEYGLEAHSVYVGEVRHPVEVAAAEEDHLVRWLSKRLDEQLTVPNLSSDGLSLVGGRLLPAGGKPCAMLMYEAQSGERFTLLVARGGNGDTAFRYQEGDGFGTFYWYSGDLGYALVGPADKARLLGISRKVYEALS